MVDHDLRDETLSKKIVNAKAKNYHIFCFNTQDRDVDIDISGHTHQEKTTKILSHVNSGTLSPAQEVLTTEIPHEIPGVRINLVDLSYAHIVRESSTMYQVSSPKFLPSLSQLGQYPSLRIAELSGISSIARNHLL